MKILLVEDSKPIRRENKSALYQAGYEVICAEDGGKTLQLAREQQPDLILLDMILPKVSGPEVLRNGSVNRLPPRFRWWFLAASQRRTGRSCWKKA
jgi:DNA-binding response OmpR family regulator